MVCNKIIILKMPNSDSANNCAANNYVLHWHVTTS